MQPAKRVHKRKFLAKIRALTAIMTTREALRHYKLMSQKGARMRDVQGLLFDGDGTLIDTYDMILQSMRRILNDGEGMDLSEAELMVGVGTPLLDQMLHFTNGDVPRAERLVDEYRAHNDAIHDAGIRAFDDTAAALERFHAAGIPLGVVTSKRHELAERGFRLTGLFDFFDVFVCADDWPEHKPKPGPILHASELLGVAPEHCLYVGDSPYDIQAGNAAGCRTVAVTWGMFSAETLAAEHPTFMIDSLSELADMLGV